MTRCERIVNYFFPSVKNRERLIDNKGKVYPINYMNNKLNSSQFNFITFFPIILYRQFSQFLSLYFLLVALTQLYSPLRVGLPIAYILPLAIIIGMACIQELIDEFKRRSKDNSINGQIYK